MDNQIFHFTAASAFGLEGAISGELKRLQMKQVKLRMGLFVFRAVSWMLINATFRCASATGYIFCWQNKPVLHLICCLI